MGNEFVEFILPDQVLQVEEEVESFFVGNTGECIVGVFALEVDDQFGELVVVAELFDGIGEVLPADNSCEVSVWLAVTR